MANNEEEEEQISDSDDMPYIKCEAVYGDEDDDDEMSALPFVKTEFGGDEEDESKVNFEVKAPEVGAYVKCSVPSCHSYFEVGNPKYEGFSHFKFPEDPTLRSQWINILSLKEDWKPEGAMICSNHFPDGSFINVLEMARETGQLMTKRSLKPGAVPTLNIGVRKGPLFNNINGVNITTPIKVPVPVQTPIVRHPPPIRPAPPVVSIRPAPPPPPPPPVLTTSSVQIQPSHNQNDASHINHAAQARVVMLTKNGKRRGRPPKNASLNPGVNQTTDNPTFPLPSNGDGSSPNQTNNTSGLTKPLPPFQILGMGRRKRGRPRKEESLQRLAAGLFPIKRRKILPAPNPSKQARGSATNIEQLECNVDLGHFFAHEDVDQYQRYNDNPHLLYFQELASNVSDLSTESLVELRDVIESTLERLRSREDAADIKSNSSSEKNEEIKEKKINVDSVRIPPSVSIKPVCPKLASQGTSTSEEEPVPALTITIKRDGSKVDSLENGKTSPKSKSSEKEESEENSSTSDDGESDTDDSDGKEHEELNNGETAENDSETGDQPGNDNDDSTSSSDNEISDKVNGEVSS